MGTEESQLIQNLDVIRQEYHQKAKTIFPRSFKKVFIFMVALLGLLISLMVIFGKDSNISSQDVVGMSVGVVIGSAVLSLFIAGIYTLLRRGAVSTDFWNGVKGQTVERLAEQLELKVNYSPKGMEEHLFDRSDLFQFKVFTSLDTITTSINGKPFLMSECAARMYNSESNNFNGLFMTMPVDMKDTAGPILFLPSFKLSKYLKMLKVQRIDTTKHHFELKEIKNDQYQLGGRFEVFAPDIQQAELFLDEKKMKAIDQLERKLVEFDTSLRQTLNPTSSVYISFNEGHFHACIYWHMDLFKGNLSLKTPLHESDFLAGFKKDTKLIYDLIQIMKPLAN